MVRSSSGWRVVVCFHFGLGCVCFTEGWAHRQKQARKSTLTICARLKDNNLFGGDYIDIKPLS